VSAIELLTGHHQQQKRHAAAAAAASITVLHRSLKCCIPQLLPRLDS